MATRIYFSTTNFTVNSPTPSASWNRTTNIQRKRAMPYKDGTTLGDTGAQIGTGVNPNNSTNRQFTIEEPLGIGQTIAGTVKGQLRVLESNAALNACAQVIIRVMNGTTQQAVLLPAHTEALSSEYATTQTNRKYPLAAISPVTLTSYGPTVAGDRIVIEVGSRIYSTDTTSTFSQRYGSSAASDFLEDETTTTSLNPWMEFSQDIVFGAIPGQGTGTGSVSTTSDSIAASGIAATATGATSNAGKTLAAPITAASAAGVAANAPASLKPSSGVSAGAGMANNPTIDIEEAQEVFAAAENAPGTGAASNATKTLGPSPVQATGAGAGLLANGTLAVSIQASAGSGVAQNASTQKSVNAAAGLASGVGTAAIGVSSDLAIGPVTATGVSEGYEPTIPSPTFSFAEAAAGTGAAHNATVNVALTAQAALGTESLSAIVTDTFARSVSNSMGNADSGQAWVTQGTAADYDVDGSSATFAHTSGNATRRAWLPSVVAHDVEMSVKWKASAPAIGSTHNAFLSLRQSTIDGDFLLPRLTIGTDQSMTLSLYRRAAGVETEIASQLLDITLEADTYYTIKARLVGQGFFAKAWKTVDSEPGWQVSATDTQITNPGGLGMRTYSPSGGTYPLTFSWDDLGVNQLTSVGQALNPTITANASVNVAAIEATGAGAIPDLSLTLQPNAVIAPGIGASYVLSSTNAPGMGVADGLGTSTDSIFEMAVNSEHIANIGEAYGIESPSTEVGASVATGTGSASGLSPAVAFTPYQATSTATVLTLTPFITPFSGQATATGDAYSINTFSASVAANTAIGTGVANVTIAGLDMSAGAATGIGAALDSTAQAVSIINVAGSVVLIDAIRDTVVIASSGDSLVLSEAVVGSATVAESSDSLVLVGSGLGSVDLS